MNREFFENIICELTDVSGDLEKLALLKASTSIWRLHKKVQDTLKSVEFYFSQGDVDES